MEFERNWREKGWEGILKGWEFEERLMISWVGNKLDFYKFSWETKLRLGVKKNFEEEWKNADSNARIYFFFCISHQKINKIYPNFEK